MQKGRLFKSDVDTEVFVHLIAESKKKSLLDRLMECLLHVKGAYSLVLLHGDSIFGARDPYDQYCLACHL